jgi:hypothetical protein
MAAQEDQFSETVYLMLNKGKKEKFKEKLQQMPWLIEAKSKSNMTLLHLAARNGDVESIKILIEKDADPSYAGGHDGKQTALHYAAGNSRFFAIYVTALIKSLNGKDFTPFLMQIVAQNTPQNLKSGLRQTLQQITPQKFEFVLWQILEQAKSGDFSPEFGAALTHMQTQLQLQVQAQMQAQELPGLRTIANLLMILQHTDNSQDFTLLLGQMLDEICLKRSASVPISPVIHSSSPIFSPYNCSREASPDGSDLGEDSLDSDRTLIHRRRWSIS